MRVRDIIRRLEDEGWVQVRQKGSHRVFKKKGVPELIVLPDHGMGREPSIGVMRDIEKKAGWA
jgi:predicted RNA binding protein YcfA (HicA-like mRNA interferase family)